MFNYSTATTVYLCTIESTNAQGVGFKEVISSNMSIYLHKNNTYIFTI